MRFSIPNSLINTFIGFSIVCLGACGTNAPGTDASSSTADTNVVDEGNDVSSGADGAVEDFRPDGWEFDSHSKGAEADYDRIYPDDKVQRLDITISPENYQSMQDNMVELYGNPSSGGGGGPGGFASEEPSFYPVTIQYDGKTWWNVGMRYKGNSSLRSAWGRGQKKIPFRLDFDEYEDTYPEIDNQRFYGFKKITFSSGFKDNSLMREKLGGEIFRDAGVKAARSAFYRIYLDIGDGNEPVYAGLYTMVEDVSNKFLDSQFEEDSGNLYKPDGSAATWGYFSEDHFIKKTNEEEPDWSDVENAIEALHYSRSDAEAWRTNLQSYFNVSAYLKLLAVNQVIQNWDTYGTMTHNYYLYADPSDDGRLLWIPWDLNECMLAPGGGGPSGRASSVLLDEVTSQWPVIRFLLDDPIYAAQYHSEVAAVVDGSFAIDKMTTRMEELHELIAPYVVGTTGEQAPYSLLEGNNAFETSLTSNNSGLIPHVENRHQMVEEALQSVSH